MSTATCGRRSSSTSCRTPSSSPSRAGSPLQLRSSDDRGSRRARSSATPASAFRSPSCRGCSSASTGSRASAAARSKAPASASPWCRSSSGCTAERSRPRARRASGATFTISHPVRNRPSRGGQDRQRRARGPRPRCAPAPSSRRRCAGCRPAGRRGGDARRPGRRSAATFRSPGGPPAPRILVADDNADMRNYVRRLLEPRWEVEAVSDGRAALEAIRARKPDLVLTDVMMPGLDGFGLLRELRADTALARPAGDRAFGARRRGSAGGRPGRRRRTTI